VSVTWYASAAAAHGSTSLSIPVGAGIGADQMSILMAYTKPTTATIGTPTNWTPLLNVTGGTGSQGADTGPIRMAVFYREGAFSGNQAVTITGGDSSGGMCLTGQRTLGAWVTPVAVSGDDTTGASAVFSAVMGSNPGVTAGDWLLGFMAIPTDASTIAIGGAPASPVFSITGISGGSVIGYYSETGTGLDSALGLLRWQAFTGTASSAATVGGTYTGATNTYGPAIMVRLRDEAGAAAGRPPQRRSSRSRRPFPSKVVFAR
jgi:hypothetical protein